MARIILKLYISGRTPRTERAVANLSRILDALPAADYEFSVCDVVDQPQAAEEDKILATPTLILISPPPARRIVGDFSETEKVFSYLGLPLQPPLKREEPA
ncbi:MAG TPA: circadian clock KaiB family protein [Thermodesulfovibrionales bacterium]|jgi:circadian clock protein KaiB|nr:circadian clock KaiB family protein [Thermodesulfovibrionales bacterium]